MAPLSSTSPMAFADFPEDVQLTILSFLSPADIASFASTSRRFASLCSHPNLWFSMCHRRWGSNTLVHTWAGGSAAGSNSSIPFSLLYRTLDRWENLVGFWRRVGQGSSETPPLVFFEWGPSFIVGSRVSPSMDAGSYSVVKEPFLWMGLSQQGEQVGFVYTGRWVEPSGDGPLKSVLRLGLSSPELVPVTVSFVGRGHLVVEEKRSFYESAWKGHGMGISEDTVESLSVSAPDHLMLEIYQYFAKRMSPGGNGATGSQRKRERERFGKSKWETEHSVKIVNCCPAPSRPLQGLWKGICENMKLDFFLVTYDDIGGNISCRRVGDALEPFSGHSPVFWTSNTTYLEFPFPIEEEDTYESREHIQPMTLNCITAQKEAVSRILCINSSYDLVIPDLYGSSVNPRNVEGRIWEYKNGTFGFGFLRNEFIIDLKHIVLNGCLLDTIEHCKNASSSQ